jgi:uncharacterized protein (TIGR00369 family)
MSDSSDPYDDFLSPFNRHLGMRITKWEEGRVRLTCTIQDFMGNRSGAMHGGVSATLIDAACGYAVTHPLPDGTKRLAITLSMTTNYTGAAREGELTIDAVRKGGGNTITFAEATITNADGEKVAFGTATLRYIKR